jgi:hypothetical protein
MNNKWVLIFVSTLILLPATLFADGYQVYFGNIHSHTGVSDGEKSPAVAYAYARDTAKLDFFAVTDHEEQIGQNIFEHEWDEIKDAANATQVAGKYVTLYGYEWGSPLNGHLNFFMQDHKYTDLLIYLLPVSLLWNEFKDDPPVLGQFNHPKASDNNWNDFEYDARADQGISLMEVREPYTASDDSEAHEKAYIRALDKGWHISAVANQDNHGADWGAKNEHRTAVWTDVFTREGVLAALQAGHCYSTLEKNMVFWFSCDGFIMGDTSPVRDMNCTVMVDDPDVSETVSSIEVVTRGGLLVWNVLNPAKGVEQYFTLHADTASSNYFYARVLMSNGTRAWSGPIYYKEGGPKPDGGTFDSGFKDGGASDASSVDGGLADASAPDGGHADGSDIDSGLPDGGVEQDGGTVQDAGTEQDSGVAEDAATSEDAAASNDAAIPVDAGSPDDSGIGQDVLVADSGITPDGGTGSPDGQIGVDGAAPEDSGLESTEVVVGCSCSVVSIER